MEPFLEANEILVKPGGMTYQNPILKTASMIAMSHHERWDGNGYPQGLQGETIPLDARITALADVYDALRTERPYKAAFSEEKTRRILAEEAGRQFDPRIHAAFEEAADEFNAIREKYHDSGY